jgi:hypothetical protein
MFCKFLGASKLSHKNDFPVIPAHGFDANNTPLVDGSQNVRQVRFDWDKGVKDPSNHQAIMKIVSFTRSHGTQYLSEAAPALALVNAGDLEARAKLKYDALRRIWREGKKKEGIVEPGDTNEEEAEVNKPVATAAEIRKYANRARGVSLTVRQS